MRAQRDPIQYELGRSCPAPIGVAPTSKCHDRWRTGGLAKNVKWRNTKCADDFQRKNHQRHSQVRALRQMSATEATTVKERVSSYLYFGSLYFISVGLLYLWGYWASFDVNVLEYISLTDVLKLTAYPIASAFVFFALGAVIGELLVDRSPLTPGAGRDTPTGRFLRRAAPYIVVTYAIGTVALLLFGPVSKWNVLPILCAFPIYAVAKERGLLLSLLPHDSARSIVLFLLAVLPTWAYGHGRIQAAALLEGSDYKYLVANTVEGMTIDPNDAASRVKYVGHAGDYEFLLLPDNVTLAIVRFDKIKGLQLRRFKSPSVAPKEGSNSGMQPTPKNGAADAKR